MPVKIDQLILSLLLSTFLFYKFAAENRKKNYE